MYSRIAAIVALFVLSVNIFRAATQSITIDEAYTYNLFLDGDWGHLFSRSYDACHHGLHTILTKISISVFGLSEFTLRLPSLAGGLLYLAAARRICLEAFGARRRMLIVFCLLTFNPLILDFMSAARGYGLALALFLWALYQVLRYTGGERTTSRVYSAALCLSLAVGSNLTLAVPGISLALFFFILLALEGRLAEAVDQFIVPGVVTCFVIVLLPLLKASRDNFYLGTETVKEALESLLALSFYHHTIGPPFVWFIPPHDVWFRLFISWIVPAVLICGIVGAALVIFSARRVGGLNILEGGPRLLLIVGLVLGSSAGLLATLNKWAHVPYPWARTGLYFIPLITLTALALPEIPQIGSRLRRLTRLTVFAFALLCLGFYLVQFQTKLYGEWPGDAGNKQIVSLIRSLRPPAHPGHVRIGISWELEPAMNFYRRLYRLDLIAPFNREGPDGDFDYYVILPREGSLVEKRKLRVLYRDPVSGVMLAVAGT